jgi:hypothetical protein
MGADGCQAECRIGGREAAKANAWHEFARHLLPQYQVGVTTLIGLFAAYARI